MNRIDTAMDAILAQLTDGVFTSAGQLRGYLSPDRIAEGGLLPFVQVFSPTIDSGPQSFGERPNVGTFQLQIIDKSGREDFLRGVLDTLQRELRADPSLGTALPLLEGSLDPPIVAVPPGSGFQSIHLDIDSVAERGPFETTVANATVRVTFEDQTGHPEYTPILDLVGNADLCSRVSGSSAGDVFTDSTLIPGAIALQKGSGALQTSGIDFDTFPEYPLDLSGFARLRFVGYNRTTSTPIAGAGVDFVFVRLSSPGELNQWTVIPQTARLAAGWFNGVIDLSEPDGALVIDLSNVTKIQILLNYVFGFSQFSDPMFFMKRIEASPLDLVDAAPITPISRPDDAMREVLNMLSDGILPGASTLVGYLPPEKIAEANEFPFAMAHSPIITTNDETYRERPTEITFTLLLIDRPERASVLRDALESLSQQLRDDPARGGAQRTIAIGAQAADERGPDEPSIATALVTVNYGDSASNALQVDLLDLVDSAVFFSSPGSADFITNSLVIPGGVAAEVRGNGSDRLTMRFRTFPEFPLDMSGLKFARLLFYNRENDAEDVGGPERYEVRFESTGGPRSEYCFAGSQVGWIELVFDLDNPDGEALGGADFSDITEIDFIRFVTDVNYSQDGDEGLILWRLYHTEADTVAATVATPGATRSEDAMNAVLNVVTSGLFTSVTQQRGYTAPDKIPERAQFPFVQVYQAGTEMSDAEFQERPNTIPFQMDIIDRFGREDTLRAMMDALADALRNDPSLGQVGAREIAISSQDIDERGPDETTVASASFVVEYRDTDADPTEVDVLDLVGNADLCTPGTGIDIITDSVLIPGGIALQKQSNSIFVLLDFANFTEYPIDLSASVTQQLRFLFYNRSFNTFDNGGISSYSFSVTDGSSNVNRYTVVEGRAGWHELVADLDNPTVDGNADLSDITNIALFLIYDDGPLLQDVEGIIVKRIYYTARDTGSNPIAVTF